MNPFARLDEWAVEHYDGYALREFLISHVDCAIYIAAAYLFIVFLSPPLIQKYVLSGVDPNKGYQKPIWLRILWTTWNASLCIFSYYGSSRIVPRMITTSYEKGLHYTLCHLDREEFYSGTFGFAIGLYVLSKGPEFADTFFILLTGKKVPFLQWFHHVTTFLYCWHAYAVGSSALNFGASLNYSVHVVMYFYFTLSEAGFKSLVRPFARFITSIQLFQFLFGSYLTLKLLYHKVTDYGKADSCDGTPWDAARVQLFIVMANLIMFSQFFYNSYIKKKDNKKKKSA